MRVKETENDYRYFPDPDLVPMKFEEAYIEGLRASLPELPLAKTKRYRDKLGLGEKDASRLTADKEWAEFFEEAIELGGDPKLVSNWLTGDFASLLNESGITARESRITPAHIVDLLKVLESGTISGKMAKEVFTECYRGGGTPSEIVKSKGLSQISDGGALAAVVSEVLRSNPEVVSKYKGGQVAVKGFLVGQVMKSSGGRANPAMVQDLVQEALDQA